MTAASTAVRGVLTGADRPARVVAAGPAAVYLQVEGQDVVALVTRDAVRVPVAVVVAQVAGERPFGSPLGRPLSSPLGSPFGAVLPGASGVVGSGRIALSLRGDDACWTVRRWWAPATVRPAPALDAAAAQRVVRALPAASAPGLDRLEVDLARAVTAGDDARTVAAVHAMVGLGEGLTPEADDVLAGLLVALVANGSLPAALRDAVTAALPRTTTVSAALLRQALLGHAVPQLAAFVAAPSSASARAALLAVGHTSGAALARGAMTGLTMSSQPREAVA